MYSIIYTRHSNPDIWLVSQIAFKKKKKKKEGAYLKVTLFSHSIFGHDLQPSSIY